MKKERFAESDLEAFIKFSRRSPKFYKEFILSFDNKEAIGVAIKLAINLEDDKYDKGYIYDLFRILKDVSIFYGIYENEEQYCKDSHLSYTKK